MVIKKKVIYRKSSFLDFFQYFIGIFISILYGFTLIPFHSIAIAPILAIALLIQLIFSAIRLRIINVFLELILLINILLSIIPLFGYVFRFLGIVLSILDMATFKSDVYYEKIEIIYENNFSKKSKSKKNKNSNKIIDIE
jgi:hypothetical protein